MHVTAKVVDHDFGASLGQSQGMLFTQSTTSACDNGDTSVKINAHLDSLI
jgi:hypothetical protein